MRVIGDAAPLQANPIEVVQGNGERMLAREGASADLVRAVAVVLRSRADDHSLSRQTRKINNESYSVPIL